MPLFQTIDSKGGFNAGPGLAAVLKKIAANFGLLEPAVTVSNAANYQPVLGDKIISRTNAGAQTLTIPPNATVAFPIGYEIKAIQSGAGALTIVAGAGVTINRLRTLALGGQYGVARLTKISANVWNATGDLT